MNRKIIIGIVLIIVLVFMGYFIVKRVLNNEEYWITDNEFLYDKAIEYIENEQMNGGFGKGEQDYRVFTDYEGFGITQKNEKKYVYMWILEESYYIENNVVRISSGSSMPYKFIFENNEVLTYEIPKDGSYYTPSIKKIFPKAIQSKVLGYSMEDNHIKERVNEYYQNLSNDKMESMNSSRNHLEEKQNINSTINVINSSNMTMPNTNVVVSNNTVSQNQVPEEKDYSVDIDKVKIEVDKSTISSKSISIIITNNNENELSFGEEFKIQKNVNGNWIYLDYVSDKLYWNSIALITKGNSQTTRKLDIEHYYGKLDNGIYRVVKPVFGGNGEVNIYSDEFEIK